MAYPQLYPKVAPMTNTTRPIMTGTEPLSGVLLLLSIMAKTHPTKRAVPNTYEMYTHTGHAMLSRIPWNTTRISAYACLSVCRSGAIGLSVCLISVYLPVNLFVYLPASLSACRSVCLFVCLSVCQYACLPVYLSLCLSALLHAYPRLVSLQSYFLWVFNLYSFIYLFIYLFISYLSFY